MGFGFVIERFGLFLHMFVATEGKEWQRNSSFWVGICFILLGALVQFSSVAQYRSVLKTLKADRNSGRLLGQYWRIHESRHFAGWHGDYTLLLLRALNEMSMRRPRSLTSREEPKLRDKHSPPVRRDLIHKA